MTLDLDSRLVLMCKLQPYYMWDLGQLCHYNVQVWRCQSMSSSTSRQQANSWNIWLVRDCYLPGAVFWSHWNTTRHLGIQYWSKQFSVFLLCKQIYDCKKLFCREKLENFVSECHPKIAIAQKHYMWMETHQFLSLCFVLNALIHFLLLHLPLLFLIIVHNLCMSK